MRLQFVSGCVKLNPSVRASLPLLNGANDLLKLNL
jgi:hypothetical protein